MRIKRKVSILNNKKIILLVWLIFSISGCAKKQVIDFNEIRKAADRATEQIGSQSDYSSKKTTSTQSTIHKII